MDKIYESLGIDKLDEEKQTEIKQYLDETIELKAKEIAEGKIEEEKEKLVEKYEGKFEEYKDDITSKFSNFVDDILKEELELPEKIKEYAQIGERYKPIMDQLKTMLAIDEGTFDEEAKGLLKESKDEILKLKEKANKLVSENMDLEKDAKEMAAHIYLRKKCDGLTEAKRGKIMKLLEDVKSKDEIDRKFKILSEGYNFSVEEKTMYCPECDSDVEVNEENVENCTCPDCSTELKEKKTDEKTGKTNEEIEDKDKKTSLPENDIRSQWVKMIRENRY